MRFKNEFNKHKESFVRYFLAVCDTAAETERLEAELVDEELLQDEKCLNLVVGGGGVPRNFSNDGARLKKLRAYNRAHPERYSAMIEKCRQLFASGKTPELAERNRRIKETMSAGKYSDMTRERMKRWHVEHPEEYAESRKNLKESLRSEKTRIKRSASRKKWRESHTAEYEEWQKKLKEAQQTDGAKAKRRASLRKWKDSHPEEASATLRRMIDAGNKKRRKSVCRLDLKTGEVLETYASQHDAARWLVNAGYARNMNCVTSISEVCRQAACTTGYGHRQKAYGFGWRFVVEE